MKSLRLLFCFLVLSSLHAAPPEVLEARAAKWRGETHAWTPLQKGDQLTAGAEIQADRTGSLKLRFEEGSELLVGAESHMTLDALGDPSHQPLILITLNQGSADVHIGSYRYAKLAKDRRRSAVHGAGTARNSSLRPHGKTRHRVFSNSIRWRMEKSSSIGKTYQA